MDYSNGASGNGAGGKKKKKKKGGKQQAAQSTQPQSQHRRTPSANGDVEYVYDVEDAHPPLPHDAHQYQQDIRSSMAEFDDGEEPPADDDEDYDSDQDPNYDDDESYSQTSRTAQPAPAPAAGKKKNKKKKKKGGTNGAGGGGGHEAAGGGGQVQTTRKGKDRIWNTSTAEERERIKDFWLSLGEEERRSLVKVEKEAVLRKMKEQQKHSCSCSVCGRKRTAIEEELEVLYDAYYEELEQYANQQQTNKYLGAHIPSPPHGTYANSIPPPPPPPTGPPPIHHTHQNHHVEELDDDESEDEEEEYDDEDDEDDEDVLEGSLAPSEPRPDFFNFGNSLTVQGAIAPDNTEGPGRRKTVADYCVDGGFQVGF